jgi:hypothetical protein
MSARLWLAVLSTVSVLLLASGALAPLKRMVPSAIGVRELMLLVAAVSGITVLVCCSVLLLHLTWVGRRLVVGIQYRLGRSLPRIARSLELSRDAVRLMVDPAGGKRGRAKREGFSGPRRCRVGSVRP